MDNPQETEKLNKERWLAGFFDVSGSVGITKKDSFFDNTPYDGVNCNIDISNTSSRTMFYIGLLLNNMGINYTTNCVKNTKSSKKPRWDIFLRDNDVQKFVHVFLDKVYGKRKQLDLINEFLLYKNDLIDYEDKMKFVNQFSNRIINVNKSLEIAESFDNYVTKYPDVVVLNDDDKEIVTDSFKDLYYLAGVLDGSGNFVIAHHHNRYVVSIFIVNTNKEVIKKVCSVLKNHQIGYHIKFRDASTVSIRRRWEVTVYGWSKCFKLCDMVFDKMHTKKEQCSLIKEYCYYNIHNDEQDDKIGFSCKKTLENIKKGIY